MAEETGPLFSDCDGYLQLFIALAEREKELGLSVTLNVGGMLITGLLISTTEYLDGAAKLVSEYFAKMGANPEQVQSIRDGFSLRGLISEGIEKYTTAIAEGRPLPLPNTHEYIHLKNVRFYSPSTRPWTHPPGLLWRGKASAVDGFVLGELSITPS
jgi:hypothetical protein